VARKVARFLTTYVVMTPAEAVVVTAWVMAAWLAEVWDEFPHLAITSPEKRCGKTTLLSLVGMLCPNPSQTMNMSAAVLYRLIEKEGPALTILLDEAQSLARLGSEQAHAIREIFCAGTGRNAAVYRCVGDDHDVGEFRVYCPKALAAIGGVDGVLADRCLGVRLWRKTGADRVIRFRRRQVEGPAGELAAKLADWAQGSRRLVEAAYDKAEGFDLDNDRLADLLLPLQAVLSAPGTGSWAVRVLEHYARELEQAEAQERLQTPGTQLLAACRQVLARHGDEHVSTDLLLAYLHCLPGEPWAKYSQHDKPLNAKQLSDLLRPYGIRPVLDRRRAGRGYYKAAFAQAWATLLPPLPPRDPSNPSNPSSRDRDEAARIHGFLNPGR
jgi:putative DNA primase/helicase